MHCGTWVCRIMENYVCVSEQQWGMFADCLGSFERKEHAIRRFSLSGAWGEIVFLSGLSAWRMRAVISSVCGCMCVCVCVCALLCADSNLANATFRCTEKKHFEMLVALKNFFLAQTGSRIVKTVTHEWLFHLDAEPSLKWIWEAKNHLKFLHHLLPRAGTGAFPVHDSASAGSWAVWPLRPCWPLAVDGLGSMLAKFDALTPATPLEKEKQLCQGSCIK